MSDRREELLRQREAIRAHLAWLDREIEAAPGLTPAAAVTPPTPAPGTAAAVPPAEVRLAEVEAEAILAEYRQPTMSISNQTRTGCILYFALGMAVLIFIAVSAYVGFKLRRGG